MLQDVRRHRVHSRQSKERRGVREGKVKEAAGCVTDDRSLEAKGKAERAKGHLKQAGENVKDAVKR